MDEDLKDKTVQKIIRERSEDYRYKLLKAIVSAFQTVGSPSDLHMDVAFKIDRKKIQVEVLRSIANSLEAGD